MNYIQLINAYWQLREQGILTASQGDLYMFLLHTSNKLGWKNPFTQPNALICAVLDISEKTLIRNRNILKQEGLIDFESGSAIRRPTLYYLHGSYCKNYSSDDSSHDSSFDQNAPDNTKHKQSKTKQEGEFSTENSSSGGAPPDPPKPPEAAKPVDFKNLVDWFNAETRGAFGLVKYPLGEKRQASIRARIRERGKAAFMEAVRKAVQSDFLRGQNNRGWAATLDWIIKPSNFEKILSGNYDNRTPSTQAGSGADAGFLQHVAAGIERGLKTLDQGE
jgi:hypothetical protein